MGKITAVTIKMKQKLTKLLLVASILLGVLLPAVPVAAAGASISLVANRSTVAPGGSLIVAVYMNGGGTPVNAVEADLNYPASQLQYVGLSYSGSAFSINTPSNGGGNGSISIQNGSVSAISGSALVATVTFKALASSGSAAIGISGSSNLINANDNSAVAFFGAGTSVKFGAAAASSAGSTTDAAPTPPKDTTPPTITAIKLSQVSPLGVTVTWTTNESSDSVVEFGLDTSYGLSTTASTPVTAHSLPLNSTFLTPETTFHYRVKSTDGAGNVATSPDQTFQLPGIPVTIIVRGPNGKPQAGAVVTIDNATGTTDSNGKVVLPSGLGNKKITTVYQGVSVQKPITVERNVKTMPPYQLDLSRQPLNRWVLVSITLFIIIISLLAIDAMLFGSHFFARLAGLRYMPKALVEGLEEHHEKHQPAASIPVPSTQPITSTPIQPVDALAPEAPSDILEATSAVPKDHATPVTRQITTDVMSQSLAKSIPIKEVITHHTSGKRAKPHKKP